MNIQQFTVGASNFGLLAAEDGRFIITRNDFVHGLYKADEKADINLGGVQLVQENSSERIGEIWEEFTLSQLQAIATPIPSLWEWAHYWGIKERVARNYRLLLASMRELSINMSDMPEWGADDRRQPYETVRSVQPKP